MSDGAGGNRDPRESRQRILLVLREWIHTPGQHVAIEILLHFFREPEQVEHVANSDIFIVGPVSVPASSVVLGQSDSLCEYWLQKQPAG